VSDYSVIDIETTGSDPRVHQLVSVGIGLNVHRPDRGRQMARMLMSRPGTTIVAHTNYDLRWLMLDGAKLADGVHYHDTKVMAWLLDGTQDLDLESLSVRYLGFAPPKLIRMRAGVVCFETTRGHIVPITEAPWEEVEAYNQSDIKTEGELYETLRALLQEQGLWEHFITEEAPFSRLLVEMEAAGLPYDRERGAAMLADTERTQAGLRRRLVEDTGDPEFNPGSGDQVAKYLYEEVWTAPAKFEIPRLTGMSAERKLAAVESIAPPGVHVTKVGRDYAYGHLILDGLGLAPPKAKKGQETKRPTVSGKVLNMMYGGNPWVANFVAYKKAEKLAGYLRDWQERSQHGGRLHGRFDQSGTITGRLAGREPNLQQVAKAGDVRDLFRHVLEAHGYEGGTLLVGDYAGLEARLAAHFSLDAVMLNIFRTGKDLYGVLAARAWGGPETKENEGRDLMKVIWLSSQYGAQGETLAQTMALAGHRGYTARKADAMLRDLHESVPRLFEWREEVIEEARALGYVTTLGGRKRHLSDIGSAEWKKMAKAERQAVNSKVQGSAADVVRRAMLAARAAVAPTEACIILQVHDEILWERGPEWADDTFPRLLAACETGHGFELDVPLAFEAAVVDSWAGKGGAPTGADLSEALEHAA
jgi:DNA polymerase I-like protein with 3'-5' exonuclease and polymerase domains